jgi:cytochrome c biogenesis protein CcdA
MKKRVAGLILSFLLFGVLDLLLGILIPDRVLNAAFAVMVTVMLMGAVLVGYGTLTRNRWGVNLQQINCPRCHAPVAKVRKPETRRERLWGGATCDKCGCEMDKWGTPIAP